MVRHSNIEMTKEELFDETEKLLESYDLQRRIEMFVCDRVEQLKWDLLLLARTLYSDRSVEAYLYGSRMTGLAQSDSDVDIYLDIGGTFDGSISEDMEEQVDRVEQFENAMLCEDQKFRVIVALKEECQVPILRFKHIGTDLQCDLSFRSGMSYKSSELVKFYLEWDPRVKYVVTGVKVFMKKCGLAGPNLFNSNAQVWLALFFLMQKGIELIPSLVCLRTLTTQIGPQVMQSMVEYWDCTVPKVHENWQEKWIDRKCSLSSEELLTKFFTFYRRLPPLENEFVLTTYNGMITKKKKVFFRSRRPIRRFYGTYRAKKGTKNFVTMKKKYRDAIDGRFYLQDPFHQLKNLTKMWSDNVSRDRMAQFVEYCKQMALKME